MWYIAIWATGLPAACKACKLPCSRQRLFDPPAPEKHPCGSAGVKALTGKQQSPEPDLPQGASETGGAKESLDRIKEKRSNIY